MSALSLSTPSPEAGGDSPSFALTPCTNSESAPKAFSRGRTTSTPDLKPRYMLVTERAVTPTYEMTPAVPYCFRNFLAENDICVI
ncbi:unnamed protein product [Pseudo-nitzschia multistriata]|uniref:Uncharacterized protein n=1 Tax=Pseudo-nitzschia multistriata TaxID=183589 RepID=A0A448ZKK1_9STRA|nr:unnamed protein product [Pseudo-nitzschia multistriata]